MYRSHHSWPQQDVDELSASSPGRFTPVESAPGSHLLRSWVGRRAGLTLSQKNLLLLPGIEPRPSST